MKVNISVVGRFHAFNLAQQLKKHNVLNKLITTYPKFKVKEWGLEDSEIVSELYLEILNRYRKKIPFISNETINKIVKIQHAKNSAKYVDEADIIVGWSGSSLETIIEAKRKGKVSIVVRGSSHYTYQMKVLNEEYSKYNLNFLPHYAHWQRELLEYELADYIQVNSSFVKRSFLEAGFPEEKIIMVNTGVNLKEFKQIPREDNVFRIIFAGGATLRKGYHYLLQAFYELNLPNVEVWHLGSINDEIKPFLDKYKTDKWILKGHKPQNELYKYYSQGSVFVLPSLEEGLAMVQAQAMACGLPLICTTNTGGEDFISKNGKEGFVIPIRDVEALKEKILYLYENQDICYQMGQEAKKTISTGYTWDDYGDKIVNKYKEILEVKK